ncbi:beta-1,6-N-acetylglucosaminyltransferase [Faucicola mancuniensis]|uniref:beta-1,6-N-acetylglucosaminyltransferase n=1 Tax=Faucicola mancuniensis TaxID=1309795 RepID=UPI00397785A2
MKKHAVLIQTHKPIDYFIQLAKREKNVNFYVHFDKKVKNFEKVNLENIYYLDNRIDVKWGGFSQVQATLNLFETAFSNSENAYFHLVSGEDVVLQDFDFIEKNWKENFNFAVMLQCEQNPKYRYRFIMNALHADSDWQRSFVGKVLTKLQQGFAKVVLYQKLTFFGSQWFSVTREDWAKILPFVQEYSEFFCQKLVPDEHFLQTLITEKLHNQISLSNDNKRLIIFDKTVNNGNSPLYLSFEQLQTAKNNGFWFARKVKNDVAEQWLIGND